MNRGLWVFVGAVLTFASSWLGLVVAPYLQLNGQPAFRESPAAEEYPRPPTGAEAAGRAVYQANGCIYCHSQQVRSQHFGNGADQARGWGQRRTVSRDYIYDRPVLLGTQRTGPDLSAIGERNQSPSWHHEHLFNPRSKTEWSVMPSLPFLYKREKVDGSKKAADALDLGREWTAVPGYRYRPTDAQWAAAVSSGGPDLKKQYEAAHPGRSLNLNDAAHRQTLLDFWLSTPEDDFQVVPTADAENLVAFILSLRKTATPLPEANEP